MKRKLFVVLMSLLITAIGATSIGLLGWYLVLKFKSDDPETTTHTHKYIVQSVTEPTCTGRGYSTFVCKCGKSYTGEYTSALGHDLDGDNTCTRCGFFQHEHEYEKTVIEPTCTEQGYTKGKCIHCTAGFTAYYTAPLGHNFIDGVCTRCGEMSPSEGLIYTLSADGTYYICSDGLYDIKLIIIASVYNGKPVREIYSYAFDFCSVERVIIPNGIRSIGYSAFLSCQSLKTVTIPKTVTKIEPTAFSLCHNLTDINFNGSVAEWNAINKSGWDNDTGDYTVHCTDGDIEKAVAENAIIDNLWYILSNDKTYYICNGVDQTISSIISSANIVSEIDGIPVRQIAYSAFGNSQEIQHVTISADLTLIDKNAFNNCSKLSYVIINGSVKEIGDNAFYGCTNLTGIELPEGLTKIGKNAFTYCTTLNSITLPESVIQIGSSAFSRCYKLQSVTLPDGLPSIGDSAFSYCNNLERITIPDSVTQIGDYVFQSCTILTDIELGSSVTSIGTGVFRDCVNLVNMVIPDNVTNVGNYAFYGCERLESVTLTKNFTSIESYTFTSCPLLKDITFNDTVKKWQSIRGTSWLYMSVNCTIHCTDGDLTLIGKD